MEKSKKNWGFDLDATIIKMLVIELASKKLGYKYTSEDMLTWGFTDFPEDVRTEIFRLFNSPDICDYATPTKGSQTKIQEIAGRGHNIILITAREKVIHPQTIEMVARLFPEIQDVNFVEPHHSKLNTMLDKKLDYWVDDAPHGVLEAMDAGIQTILVSNNHTKYNWGVRTDPRLIQVVNSISEISEEYL